MQQNKRRKSLLFLTAIIYGLLMIFGSQLAQSASVAVNDANNDALDASSNISTVMSVVAITTTTTTPTPTPTTLDDLGANTNGNNAIEMNTTVSTTTTIEQMEHEATTLLNLNSVDGSTTFAENLPQTTTEPLIITTTPTTTNENLTTVNNNKLVTSTAAYLNGKCKII